jgi:hypothetical protein
MALLVSILYLKTKLSLMIISTYNKSLDPYKNLYALMKYGFNQQINSAVF